MAREEFMIRESLRIQRIGYPQRKDAGLPYVRFEGIHGTFLGAIGGAKGDVALARKLIRWLESTLPKKKSKRRVK